MTVRAPIPVLACLLAGTALAELRPVREPLRSEGNTRTWVFKSTPQGDLETIAFLPPGWKAGQKNAAIVMWFGGGFTNGSAKQFESKARYLAARGMVAITPDYRVKSRQKTNPEDSVEDARSAIRWIRVNAAALGVDPGRIAASGGSAGATCAVMTALSSDFEPAGEDRAVSSRPNALILFNPAVTVPGDNSAPEAASRVLAAWHVTKGDPPMILFFGADDKWLIPSREMAKRSAALGNHVELYVAPGVGHGFFNDSTQARNGVPGWHEAVLYRTDIFLRSLGYLSGAPTVQAPAANVLTREALR